MAAKNPHGLQIYDLLLDIIMDLSPNQAEKLYSELLVRYTKRARVKLYNADGELDQENGKIRLLPSQYQAIRTMYGDTYVKKSFTELYNYISFLEKYQDSNSKYKTKLKKYTSETHNVVLTKGWVYDKCKQYIIKERPKVNVNPFMIEDFATAKEYIKTIPKEMREKAIDVQMLIMKFPELADIE